jgi:nucleotide-binding universal stress UspA family protein
MRSTTAGFRHILCPVDFSPDSRRALRHARALAEQCGAKLTVLAVNDPMLAAALAAATHDPWRLDAESLTELRRFVSTTLGPLGATTAVKVVMGDPADQIDRVAQRLKVDLVVMGTHGLSGPKKWFFGSTTESLFRRSKVPVLAVPARGRGSSRHPYRFSGETFLAPIELDGTDRSEIRRVMDIVNRFGAKALFLHVVKPAQAPSWLAGKAGAVDRHRMEEARTRIRQLVAPSMARTRVVSGDPVKQIEQAAVSVNASAIVMTLKGHGPFGPRRGSITYRVVCSGVAAVLALPPERGPR